MKKKLSALLLAALLVATSVAACGKSGGGNVNDSSSGSSDNSFSSSDDSLSSSDSSWDSSDSSWDSSDSSWDSSDSSWDSSDDSSSEDSSGDSSDDREYIDGGSMSDDAEHYVSEEKRLHDKKITETGREFVVNGATEYKIILGTDDTRATDAANFLAQQIGKATGASLSFFVDADQNLEIDNTAVLNRTLEFTPDTKYIVLSHEKLEEEAGIEWRSDVDLDYSGYMIKTMGDSVFMKINSFYGYQKVAQAFLREVVGYEWYSYDTIVYTKDGSTLPNMDIVEKPDFDLTWNSGYMAPGNYLASPLTKEDVFTTINGKFCHNSFDYIPTSLYDEHPDWFAWESAMPLLQLCYTAHGNKEEYDAMIEYAFKGVMQTLAEHPDDAVLTFTREDYYGHCICDTCKMLQSTFNDSLAVTYMFFVNDLDTKVQAELQRQADESGQPKREITILFFAYRQTSAAPVFGTDGDYTVPSLDYVENADGTKVNVLEYNDEIIELPFHRTYENGLECNEHVGVFYAPIDATFEESFYHQENKKHKETFEKWGLLTDRLYCWIYDTNFTRYIVPYNSYDAIPDTLRFLKDAGGTFLFNQGDRENGIYTGFGTLRTYLTYTLANDVNLDAGVLTDKFFENYFREAAPAMKKFYNLLVAHMEQLQVEYPGTFYTQRRTNSEEARYWPHATLVNWLDLCDEAFIAIKKYETSDPELYESLYKHIVAETIFPRYMLCQYYTGYYTPTAVNEMRSSFIADCKLIDYRAHAEQVSIQPIFESWGF